MVVQWYIIGQVVIVNSVKIIVGMDHWLNNVICICDSVSFDVDTCMQSCTQ